MTTAEPRPAAVTRACLIAGTGAVLTLFIIFSLLSDWGSLEIRQQVETALTRSPIPGVSADEVLEIARVLFMVIAVFAVAAIVLCVFTARRDRSARIALTVLAAGWIPVALLFGIPGVALSVLGGVTVALLVKPESRRWFAVDAGAGGAHPPRPLERASMSSPPPPGHGGPPPYGPGQPWPPPTGLPPSGPAYGPPAYGPPSAGTPASGPPPYGTPEWTLPDRRPDGVTVAAWITLVAASLAALGCGILSLTFLLARDAFEEGISGVMTDFNASEQSFITSFIGWYFFVCGLLSIVAIGLAIALLRNRHRVRVPLVVMSGITAVLALVAFPGGLLWSAAAISVIILLFAGSAGAWFDLRNHRADEKRASY